MKILLRAFTRRWSSAARRRGGRRRFSTSASRLITSSAAKKFLTTSSATAPAVAETELSAGLLVLGLELRQRDAHEPTLTEFHSLLGL